MIKHLILQKILDRYQRGLASMVYKCFDKKYFGDAGIRADKSALKRKLYETNN